MPEMRVGVAAVEITPPPGLPLMGNFRDDYLARGVHDPLLAKAIVFEDAQGANAAVLAVDVCMLDRGNVAVMREAIGRSARVPPAHVLVHATHTHSAPAPHDRFLFGLDYRPYRAAAETMLVKAAGAVALAEQNLAQADLSVGYAHEDRLSFNRRLRRKDGTTQMNWEALAPGFDPG
ncbi:MAG: neutral/alkaline non-lysosomal ceramidase N-terminal domain-containing protein, partial [Pirellulaceae bacterium]|nr:neutral/alkaline non-lysosomal ceramidase N-terminal domain-containing protein [Pirellulaceae bacterium]